MTIDKELITMNVSPFALALNQITSAQALRWFVVITLTLLVGVLFILGREVPQELLGMFLFIVGSLFDTPTLVGEGKGNGDAEML